MKPPTLRETVLEQSKCGLVRRIKLELVADSIIEEMPYESLIEHAMEMFRSDLEEIDCSEIEFQFQEIFPGEVENYFNQIEMLMEYEAELLSPEKLRDHAVACVIIDISHYSDSSLNFHISKLETEDYTL